MIKFSRRSFITTLVAFFSSSNLAISKTKKPNILLIIADDMRFDSYGSFPNREVFTPNIDKLSKSGVKFVNNFVTTPICPSSRASILTGRPSNIHEVWDFKTPISKRIIDKSLPKYLNEHGYQTGFVGKWGIAGTIPIPGLFGYFNGFADAFHYFLYSINSKKIHLTEYLFNACSEFLKRINSSKPFFLIASFKAPHSSNVVEDDFSPSDKDLELYKNIKNFKNPLTSNKTFFDLLPPLLKNSLGRQRWKKRFSNKKYSQTTIKNYYALITGIDRQVGNLIELLQKKKLYDNTIIIFTSDNGMALGDRQITGKWHLYEESIRTPLIIKLPEDFNSSHSQIYQEMSLNIDIMPTILDFAGCLNKQTYDYKNEGKSLKKLLNHNKKIRWRQKAFFEILYEHNEIPKCLGIRTKDFKYMFFLQDKYECLFHIKVDPLEKYNLIDNKRFQKHLESFRKSLIRKYKVDFNTKVI